MRFGRNGIGVRSLLGLCLHAGEEENITTALVTWSSCSGSALTWLEPLIAATLQPPARSGGLSHQLPLFYVSRELIFHKAGLPGCVSEEPHPSGLRLFALDLMSPSCASVKRLSFLTQVPMTGKQG